MRVVWPGRHALHRPRHRESHKDGLPSPDQQGSKEGNRSSIADTPRGIDKTGEADTKDNRNGKVEIYAKKQHRRGHYEEEVDEEADGEDQDRYHQKYPQNQRRPQKNYVPQPRGWGIGRQSTPWPNENHSSDQPQLEKKRMSEAKSASSKPRTIYDEYSIRSEIGKGGYSRVYRAVHRETGKVVAIKVMGIEPFDTEMENIVDNEIAIMERIRDEIPEFAPNLVQIIDVLHEPGHELETARVCIIMEYLGGGELFDRVVRKRHYTEIDACAIMSEIVRAVKALHTNGIIHRDLKPENIVFENESDRSNVKIMDFGLAQMVDEPDAHTSLEYIGTLGYVAPEILLYKEYTPACDIFSLGVILYILLVGRQPFRSRNAAEQIIKTKTGAYSLDGPQWDEVSDYAKDLVERMLDVDPTTRITIDEILRHPWMYASNLQAATRHLAGTLSELRNFNDRRKMRVMAEHVVGQTTDDLRLALMGLLENSASHASGLSAREMLKLISSLQALRKQGHINREQFVKLLQGVGLKSLPASDIFDVLLEHGSFSTAARSRPRRRAGGTTALETESIDGKEDPKGAEDTHSEHANDGALHGNRAKRRISAKSRMFHHHDIHHGVDDARSRNDEDSELDEHVSEDDDTNADEDTLEEPTLDADELVVGLAVIAAKESRERVLQGVFGFLASSSAKSQPGRLTAGGYSKLLRLIASYESPGQKRQYRNRIANDLATVFSDGAETSRAAQGSSEQDSRLSGTRKSLPRGSKARKSDANAQADDGVKDTDTDAHREVDEVESGETTPGDISFEDFRRGVLGIGDQVLLGYLSWNRLMRSFTQLDQHTSPHSSFKRVTSYLSKMATFSKNVGDSYTPRQ